MKPFAIAIVILFICGALYTVDRAATQRKTIHAADSLDSINASQIRYSVDSLTGSNTRRFNASIFQLKRHIDFQERRIYKLEQRIKFLDSASHVHSEVIKNPFGQKLTR